MKGQKMENLAPLLQGQLDEINQLLNKTKSNLSKLESIPSDSIRATKSRNTTQFYRRAEGSQKSVYVPASEKGFIQKILQKEYENKVLKQLLFDQKLIKRFLRGYNPSSVSDIYQNYCNGKRELITPAISTDETFITTWYANHPGSQNSYPMSQHYETMAGEQVRSKSEKIIADLLHQSGIPYRYEPCVFLDNNTRVYPDFAVLNVRKRKTFYWEHLGLTSDNDYARKNLEKILFYESNNLFLGESLIISQESETVPLNIRMIRQKISKYLV